MIYIINCEKCDNKMKSIGSDQNGKIYVCEKCNNIKFNFNERSKAE